MHHSAISSAEGLTGKTLPAEHSTERCLTATTHVCNDTRTVSALTAQHPIHSSVVRIETLSSSSSSLQDLSGDTGEKRCSVRASVREAGGRVWRTGSQGGAREEGGDTRRPLSPHLPSLDQHPEPSARAKVLLHQEDSPYVGSNAASWMVRLSDGSQRRQEEKILDQSPNNHYQSNTVIY
ncbi:unnamed protein product [Boreogadus saida]